MGILASPSGFTQSGGTLFFGRARDDGDTGFYLGQPDGLGELFDQARGAGRLDRLGWIHLPRGDPLPAGVAVKDEWDLLWTARPPATQPAQETVAARPPY